MATWLRASSAAEPDAHAAVDQPRRTCRRGIRLYERDLVQQVLHAGEQLQVPAESARCGEIDSRVTGQASTERRVVSRIGQRRRGDEVHVLVVVVLQPGELDGQGDTG